MGYVPLWAAVEPLMRFDVFVARAGKQFHKLKITNLLRISHALVAGMHQQTWRDVGAIVMQVLPRRLISTSKYNLKVLPIKLLFEILRYRSGNP